MSVVMCDAFEEFWSPPLCTPTGVHLARWAFFSRTPHFCVIKTFANKGPPDWPLFVWARCSKYLNLPHNKRIFAVLFFVFFLFYVYLYLTFFAFSDWFWFFSFFLLILLSHLSNIFVMFDSFLLYFWHFVFIFDFFWVHNFYRLCVSCAPRIAKGHKTPLGKLKHFPRHGASKLHEDK